MELKNLLAELKALRSKLNLTTYAATFGPDPNARASAVQEAQAVQLTIEGVLAKSWTAAEQITRFARQPDTSNRLATLDAYVQLLARIEQEGGNASLEATAMQPVDYARSVEYGAKMGGLGSGY